MNIYCGQEATNVSLWSPRVFNLTFIKNSFLWLSGRKKMYTDMYLVYTQTGFIDIYTGYLHYDIHVHTTIYMHSRAKNMKRQVETLYI